MKSFTLAFCALFATSPALAQGLNGLLGQVQTNAKASAFDAVVGSQAPALSGLTQNLSAEQKAKLLDLGLDNAGTLGQVAAGASALGLGTGALGQPAATPQPTYQVQPAAPAPVAPAYGTTTTQYQSYTQPAAPAPTYNSAPIYQQPAAPAPVYNTVPAPTAQVYQPQPVAPATTTYQSYQQPVAAPAPVYNAAPPAPVPAPQAAPQPDLLGTAIQLGLGALSN